MALYNEYSFSKRLGILIGLDMAVAMINSFVPHDWTYVRLPLAWVQFGFAAVTMTVALRRVLEDY